MQAVSQSNKDGTFINLFIALIFMTVLNNLSISSVSRIGFMAVMGVSLVGIVIGMFYLSKVKTVPKYFMFTIIYAVLFLVALISGVFQTINSRLFIVIYQFLFLISIFFMFSMINWNLNKLKVLSNLSLFFILINFALLAAKGAPIHFSGIFINANSLGLSMFLLYFFVLLRFLHKGFLPKLLLAIVVLSIIYFTSSRSIFLSLFISYITYKGWGLITKQKSIFNFYFVGVIIFISAIIFIYPKMIYWSSFNDINNFMWEYTGKNFYSGREVIWQKLLAMVDTQPLLGFGAGTSTGDFIGHNLSSHNLYVQTVFQTGYIGVSVFILMLFSIWKLLWHGRKDKKVKLSASFFIGILIQQSFEVTLTQNNMTFAILQWLIIGIGVSYSYKIYKEKKGNQQSVDTAT